MTDELNQADKDAQLIAEVGALSVMDPGVWDHYMQRWTEDVRKRIDAKFGISDGGDPPTTS